MYGACFSVVCPQAYSNTIHARPLLVITLHRPTFYKEGVAPRDKEPSLWLEVFKMIDWVPVVFVVFKVVMFGIAMFYAVKWHYDQDKKDRRTVLRAGGIAVVAFVLGLLSVGGITYLLMKSFGLDLSMP